MLPINPRDLQRQLKQLKRMGLKVEPLQGVEKVIVVLRDREIEVLEPQVLAMEFGGQRMFYVVGAVREHSKVQEAQISTSIVSISEEDVKFVAEYTGVDEETARRVLQEVGGDIAKAIEKLSATK